MPKIRCQESLCKETNPEKESWEYLAEDTLKRSRSTCICMTCIHFKYSCNKHCHTLLACNAHQRLIPQGSHLTCRCSLWNRNNSDQYDLCTEAS
ncbi:Hypothetical protein P9211_06221 [Prochlorococcus marinus str. MIT 9211]|uniref:Uncharacterized protein n=1 Tax=Prochlorococcus marinus (strain MIT 9211) TaxID=93059 RepID=A9B9P1_PROM4|nr:Hypothetical protein P9211_06221 [Prochlorococcus marinus str. MIT 9211]